MLAIVFWIVVWFAAQGAFSGDYSDNEHWATITHAVDMWQQFSFLGAGVGVFMLARHAWLSRNSSANRALILLLLTFSVFSLAHEIFYQRIFWLALGALLSQPFVSKTAHDR